MKNANLFTFLFLVRNAHNLRTRYFLRVVLEEMIQSIEIDHSSKASVSPQLFRLVTTMLFTECKVQEKKKKRESRPGFDLPPSSGLVRFFGPAR